MIGSWAKWHRGWHKCVSGCLLGMLFAGVLLVGNAWAVDTDNDGLPDTWESTHGTNPALANTDSPSDSRDDAFEVLHGLNPNGPDTIDALSVLVTPSSCDANAVNFQIETNAIGEGSGVFLALHRDYDGDGVFDSEDALPLVGEIVGDNKNYNLNTFSNDSNTLPKTINTFFTGINGSSWVAPGAYFIRVTDALGQTENQPVTVVSPDPFTPAGTVSGTVTNGAGAVANAIVYLLVSDGNDQRTVSFAFTNGAGNYTIQLPVALTPSEEFFSLFAIKQGLASNDLASGGLPGGTGVLTGKNIALSVSNATIAGQVTDYATGAAVANIPVVAELNGFKVVGYTDGSGNYSLPVLSGHNWRVTGEPTPYYYAVRFENVQNSTLDWGLYHWTVSGTNTINLKAFRTTGWIQVEAVTENDPAALPVAAANVWAFPLNVTAPLDSVNADGLTDPTGNATVGVGIGEWNVGVNATGQPLVGRAPLQGTVDIADTLPLSFPFYRQDGSIGGSVVDAGMYPLYYAVEVEIYTDQGKNGTGVPQDDVGALQVLGLTDMSGYFSLPAISGTWQVQAHDWNFDLHSQVATATVATNGDHFVEGAEVTSLSEPLVLKPMHCWNNALDTELGEEGIDIGGPCGMPNSWAVSSTWADYSDDGFEPDKTYVNWPADPRYPSSLGNGTFLKINGIYYRVLNSGTGTLYDPVLDYYWSDNNFIWAQLSDCDQETGEPIPALIVEELYFGWLEPPTSLDAKPIEWFLSTDPDGDGLFYPADNCPGEFNRDQADMDFDGIGDVCDSDIDGDTVSNASDNCKDVANTNQANLDGDAFGDACDSDDDNDGDLDGADNCPLTANADQLNTDGDAMGDACDADDDNDGDLDGADNCPLTSNADQLDTDLDGQGDACDTDDDNDGDLDGADNCPLTSNADQLDTDLDGQGNVCDADDDNDGDLDGADNCPLTANADQLDTDLDGQGNACDPDDDNDTVADLTDNCPIDANTDQANQDGDAFGDVCDNDIDGDAVPNASDNCQLTANADQANNDGDPLGDICDDNDDTDTILDIDDNCDFIANENQANLDGDALGDACDDDIDGDTKLNGADNCPLNANPGQENHDSDGLGDACDDDDDDDGDLDGADNCPLDANPDQLNTDGDALGDACDPDIDNDSVPNAADNCPVVVNADQLNTDGDTFGNACDTDDDNDTVLDGSDNCPVTANTDQLNTDGDAFGNMCDADDDNDTVLDGSDNCPLTANLDQLNTDNAADGGDVCDTDDDNDFVLDGSDNCPLNSNQNQLDSDEDAFGDTCDSACQNPDVASGLTHVVAIRANRTTVKAGSNSVGQLDIDAWPALVDVAVGNNHTVGLKPDGKLLTAGDNSNGQLNVAGWPTMHSIYAKGNNTFGITLTRAVRTTVVWPNPMYAAGSWTKMASLALGESFVVGMTTAGNAGIAGTNSAPMNVSRAAGWSNLTEIAAGSYHAVGRKDDGSVVATGLNDNGQCNVGGWSGIASVAAGSNFTVGLTNGGTVMTAGPAPSLAGWTGIAAIWARDGNVFGLKTDGKLLVAGAAPATLLANEKLGIIKVDIDHNHLPDACAPTTDSDGDGVIDSGDECPDDSENDKDGDLFCAGIGFKSPKIGDNDLCPSDSGNDADGDSICRGPDFVLPMIGGNDPCPNDPANDADTDGICAGSTFQSPMIGASDNCPIDANVDQANNDADGLGDVCDADDDNDTVADLSDNCPMTANTNQLDTDLDGQGDACDADDDNDGVLDAFPDNCPLNVNADQANNDNDGQGDVCDLDDDNDSVVDLTDNCPVTANSDQLNTDGIGDGGDACDADDDNDGVLDAFPDNCPLNVNADQANNDNDGQGDVCDLDDDNDTVADLTDNCQMAANTNQANNDNDSQGDVCDADDDNDTVIDLTDNCPMTANTDQINTDGIGDGGDACDADDDNDGVLDGPDNCPLVVNADQANNDNDGQGDLCDADDDNDTVIDLTDNCPMTANTDQVNNDADGQGDLCDPDDDNDTVVDLTDNCPMTANTNQANNDADGLGDLCDADDDNDTVVDLTDNCPMTANTNQANNDADGQGDACDPDDDNDTVVDLTDNCPMTANLDQIDTDTDGQGNTCDTDDDNDTILDGTDKCPLFASLDQTDTDLDGQGDVCDTDDDNDGYLDGNDAFSLNPLEWLDSDSDGTGDNSDICKNESPNDADNDGKCAGIGFLAPKTGDNDLCPNDANNDADNDLRCVGAGFFAPKTGGNDTCPNDPANDADNDGRCVGAGFFDPKWAGNDVCPNDPANDADGDGICVGSGFLIPYKSGGNDSCPGDPQNDKDGDGVCAEGTFLAPKTGTNDLCPNEFTNDADGDGICAGIGYLPPMTGGSDVCPNDPTNDVDGDMICGMVDPCPLDAQNDSDGDGKCANVDNCPTTANADQANFDGDGMGDVCDPDIDNDTVLNAADNCPTTPGLDQTNTDGDSLGNICDPDDDNDGVLDTPDNCPLVANADQTNTDGVADGGNACDPDDDNDGYLDGNDAFPQNPTEWLDSDTDGTGDNSDICPLDAQNDSDQDGDCGNVDNCPVVANADQANFDGDPMGDACDPDDDNDLHDDVADAFPFNAGEWLDSDSDGTGDNSDSCPLDAQNDSDGDGVCGNIDNCPVVGNADQANFDGDQMGDACDPDDDNDLHDDVADAFPFNVAEWLDSDADGTGDNGDICPLDAQNDSDGDGVCGNVDNCPDVANVDQANFDGDQMGDACDPDDDNDSYADGIDAFPFNVAEWLDSDADGTGDNSDICPLDAQNDSDGDGVCGNVDNCPVVANADQANFDGDQMGDACDPDDDNDLYDDVVDAFPFNAGEWLDSDSDGTGDNSDSCPLDAQNDSDGDGVCGNGDNCPVVANADQANFDGDLMGDVCDPDDDNDSYADGIDAFPFNVNEWLDSDADGTGDNGDSCPLDAQNDSDGDGVCGNVDNCPDVTNANQANFDGDLMGDVCDPDDDNDSYADGIDAFPFNVAEWLDSDADGTGDNSDSCPLDAQNDSDLDGDCGNVDNCPVVANADQANFDGDQMGDACDPDDDNDTYADGIDAFPLNAAEWQDTDGDGVGNNADTDDDGDSLLDGADPNPLLRDATTPGIPVVPAFSTGNQVTLSWAASLPAGVTYTVEESSSISFTPVTQTVSGIVETTTTLTNNTVGTYYYRVKAVKADYLDSTWASSASGCQVILNMDAPVSITVPTITHNGSIIVAWGASPTAGASYELYESINESMAGAVQVFSGLNRTVTLPGRSGGHTYYYQVRAVDPAAIRQPSGWMTGANGCLYDPVVVIYPNGGENFVVGNTYNLQWHEAAGATKYNLYYKSGATWTTIALNVTGNTFSWTVPSSITTSKANLVFAVNAYNSVGTLLNQGLSVGLFNIRIPAKVVYPNATGIIFETGKNQTLTWTAATGAVRNDLLYSCNEFPGYRSVVSDLGPVTSYIWSVPTNIGALTGCKVYLNAYDADNFLINQDMSDNPFSIVDPVKILTPNGGNTIMSTSSFQYKYNITWQNATGANENWLLYSVDNGPYTLIAKVAGTATSYSWSVPEVASSNVKIAINAYNAAGSFISQDYSDASFSINKTVKVGNPNGGETMITGQKITVTWEASTNAAKYKAFYSLNGGSSYSQIGTGFTTNTSIQWTIPTVASTYTNCIVTVNGYNSAGVLITNNQDKSNSTFTLKPAPVVTVTAPVTGTTLKSGDVVTLRWNAVPDASSYSLYYSETPGIWKRIVTLGPAATTYDWTVISILGVKSGCKFAVNATVYGVVVQGLVSNLTFSPSVIVTKPALAEHVPNGSTYSITWTQEPWIRSNKIYYSSNGGVNWVYVATVTDGSTNYTWTPPRVTNSNCMIGVHGFASTDASGAIVTQDNSDVFELGP